MNLNGLEFTFSGENCPEVSMSVLESADNLNTYKIIFDWKAKTEPRPVKLVFYHRCCDMYTHMKPDLYRMHNVPWGSAKEFEARLAKWMPIEQFVSKAEKNKLTIALSDVKTHLRMKSFVELPGFLLKSEIDFFVSPTSPIAQYETLLRIDTRDVEYFKALTDAARWYTSLGYKNEHVPEAAYGAVYSTWYAYLQDITAKDVLKECRMAKKAGMDTVIVDDGWQNEGLVRDYAGCGDWKPAKNRFPNVKKFADAVHSLGMKVMFWFSVPFVGYESENFERFDGKFLYQLDHIRAAVLDPRYKEVRDFLVGIYVRAVRDWGLDGLKLDFIDRFAFNGIVTPEMDYPSVEDATEALLSEIQAALRSVNPEVLIEFRQPYMGPVISAYGNMMRVWDCPMDPLVNRVAITELRMLTNGCAVHSDMIVWDNDDTSESVATHLYSAIFSVPQISVRMAEISPEHRKVLKAFLAFRNAHKDTLMKGSFVARGIHANYSRTEAVRGCERISLFNDTAVVQLQTAITNDYVINLTGADAIFLSGDTENVKYEIFDCAGNRICRVKKLKKTNTVLKVPHAGMVHFIR